jgi:hypothetical protein
LGKLENDISLQDKIGFLDETKWPGICLSTKPMRKITPLVRSLAVLLAASVCHSLHASAVSGVVDAAHAALSAGHGIVNSPLAHGFAGAQSFIGAVPDGGSTALLFGLGAAALLALRRKFATA